MKFIKRLFIFILVCTVLGVGSIVGFYFYVEPELPNAETLKDVKLETPMQIFSKDGKLLSQFGEKRRIPVTYDEIPQHLIDALVATEDSRFYEHPGIDPIGIARAVFVAATTGHARQGASTITQQLARNFFLTNERSLMRKIKEAFISIHIEQQLTKQEILELYINKIFLGYRSYGFGAAAQVYFGKDLQDLSLSEIAVLAGMPKAPSTMNPLYSLQRATDRRNVVLMRMLDEGYITQQEYTQARSEPIVSRFHGAQIELHAPYVAEMARAWAVEKYGEDAYTSGMKIFTTIDSQRQQAANDAAINNLLGYDERHGYRGAETVRWKTGETAWDKQKIADTLDTVPTYDRLIPAIVTHVDANSATVEVKHNGTQTLAWDEMKWARKFLTDDRQGDAPSSAHEIVKAGEQIWVRQVTNKEQQTVWHLSQVPNAQTAFVAVNPKDGALQALVGGFNYTHSKFNRATMSVRQVGSGIKPFIYSAALDHGMTLATLINDAPINQWDQSQGTAWRPQNSPPTYAGPTAIRIGLAQSKNVMAVRTLRAVGLDETRQYLTRFGFDLNKLPHSETIALGAGSLTPMKLAQGYSVFANGGYYVEPYFIDHIDDPFGTELYHATPKTICQQHCAQPFQATAENEFAEYDVTEDNDQQDEQYAPQVISPQTAFLVREMMYSNIWGGGDWSQGTGWNGTGWRAQQLKRRDIGGKTGTTNDSKDTWYNGYAPGLVAISWVGFDSNDRKLGRTTPNRNLGQQQVSGAEAGAKTAQPAWINFMQSALKDLPAQEKVIPEDIVQVRIDRSTGLLTDKTDASSVLEYFKAGTEPTEYVEDNLSDDIFYNTDPEESPLF